MAMLDKWTEPTPEQLKELLNYAVHGRVAVPIGRIVDLIMPVWPLEVAKYDVEVFRVFWNSPLRSKPKFRWKRLRKPLVCFGKADRWDSCLLATV